MPRRRIEFYPAALNEFDAAAAWYRERSPEAASAFKTEVRHAVRQIAEAPERWPARTRQTRCFVLHRFPFLIVYALRQNTWTSLPWPTPAVDQITGASVSARGIPGRCNSPDLSTLLRLPAPALQLRDFAREHAGDEAGEAELFQLLLDARLHLLGREVGHGEPAAGVAVAAVHRAFRAVGVGASPLLVALQRHAAGLAVPGCSGHGFSFTRDDHWHSR